MRIAPLLAILLTLVPTARADRKAGPIHRTTQDLGDYGWALGKMNDGSWDPGRVPPDPAKCTAAIAWARENGLEDEDRLSDSRFEGAPGATKSGNSNPAIRLADAPALCAAYAKTSRGLVAQFEAARALAPYVSQLTWMANVTPGQGGDAPVQNLAKAGEECRAAVDRAVAAGARLDGKLVVKEVEKTLEQARRDVCEALATQAPEYIARHREATREKREKAMAPYRAAGISGQKLELMIQYDGVYWRGVGGNTVTDPRDLAKAQVLFHWLEAADGTQVVRRYQFAGQKLLRTSEKTYRRQPGSDAFR